MPTAACAAGAAAGPVCVASASSLPPPGPKRPPAAAGSARHGDTTPDTDDDTPPAAERSPAQTCATDALGVIFSFLPLEDVASCAAACRRWADAIAAATVGRHQITVPSVRTLRALAESPMRRLVGEINISSVTLVSGDRVGSLWVAFPHLTSLTCTIDARQLVDGTALHFPDTLRSLNVTIARVVHSLTWSHLDVLLSLAVRCALTRLRVEIPGGSTPRGTPPVDTIERLLALQDTINDLEFKWTRKYGHPYWQSSNLAVFRSLPHLTRLHAGLSRWTAEELDLLTAEPAPTHLTSLDLNLYLLDASILSILVRRVPSVVHLHAVSKSLRDSALLAQLPPHSVERMVIDSLDQRHPLELARDLARYTHITALSLMRMNGSPEEVAAGVREFLPALVRLRSLTTGVLPGDITWLASAPHLADTLEHINIRVTSVSSLFHLRSLRRLRSATIEVDLGGGGGELSVELAEAESETVFLPSLASLCLTLKERPRVAPDVAVDVGRLFGRLPSLRTHHLYSRGPEWRLMPLLTKLTNITELNLDTEDALKSADLARVVSVMPHLRQLQFEGDLDNLSFLSSSARLAHSLEILIVISCTTRMALHELAHIRGLASLRFLSLTIFPGASARSGASSSSGVSRRGGQSSPQPMLASLRDLRIDFQNMYKRDGLRRGVLDQLGPMPALRTAFVGSCVPVMHPQAIVDALAHSTRLTQLTLILHDLTDAVLTSLLRPLTHLRSLKLSSACLDGLSFLSGPHIAATIEQLKIRRFDHNFEAEPPSMPTSHLHHLRALHQLRTLELALAVDRDDDEPIDEYAIEHPHFPRTTWPLLHHSGVGFSFSSK